MENAPFENSPESLCGRVFGDYKILRRVGGGATSEVYLARQISLGRNVALKLLKDELSFDENYVKRFLQEARTAAKLEHPNVVRIYEVGEFVDDSHSKFDFLLPKRLRAPRKVYRFIAQEYVDGMSLAQYLRRYGPTTIGQTIAALEQIGSALKRAYECNLVHRDVKPENIIVDTEGVIKVVDFGLARPIGPNDATWTEPSLTKTGVALGTPLYMSPEQARGQKLDSRSDVYSLGVTAYRMLAGVAPFKGETPLAVVLKHLNEKPRPLLELRPDAPPKLAALVDQMLEKNPNDRPDSPNEFLKKLADAKAEYFKLRGEVETKPLETLEGSAKAGVADRTFDLDSSVKRETRDDVSGDALFFQSENERQLFNRGMNTTAISLEWRDARLQLEDAKRVKDRGWTRGKIISRAAILVVAFLVGGGALLARNAWLDDEGVVQRKFPTVEEQYVYALEQDSPSAWLAVEKYFPEETYWTRRAQRQLAYLYVLNDDVENAEKIFAELEKNPEKGLKVDRFANVGLAWCAAKKGEFDKADQFFNVDSLNPQAAFDRLTLLLVNRYSTVRAARNPASPVPGGGPGAPGDMSGGRPGGGPGTPGDMRGGRPGGGPGEIRGERPNGGPGDTRGGQPGGWPGGGPNETRGERPNGGPGASGDMRGGQPGGWPGGGPNETRGERSNGVPGAPGDMLRNRPGDAPVDFGGAPRNADVRRERNNERSNERLNFF